MPSFSFFSPRFVFLLFLLVLGGLAGGASRLAAVDSVPVLSPLQSWRQTHFGTPDNVGDAANYADVEGDGLPNLLEYATGTSPVAVNASVVQLDVNAGRLSLSFPKVNDPSLNYTVQGRDDLLVGSWSTVVPFSGANPSVGVAGVESVVDSVLLSAQSKRFLRLSVTLTPDLDAPSAPGELVLGARTANTLSLSWSAATDNVALAAYELYDGATLIGLFHPSATSVLLTGLAPATSYSFTLRARDTSGNLSDFTAPLVAGTSGEGLPGTLAGLRYWFQAHTESDGELALWRDQSGLAHHAVQAASGQRPHIIPDALNGLPVVRFDGDDNLLLPDALSSATAGEIIAVAKIVPAPARRNTLWWFGVLHDSSYIDDTYQENFGLNGFNARPASPLAADYHIANVSIGDSVQIARLNGTVLWRQPDISVAFRSEPTLGNGTLVGDFAEIIVFDRVLTSVERDAVHTYLTAKYALAGITVPLPPALAAHVLDSTRADLAWRTAPGSAHYQVATLERRAGSGSYAVVATLGGDTDPSTGAPAFTSFTDSGLTPGETYTYRLKVTGYAGDSAYGDPVSLTTPLDSPGLPAAGLRLWLRATAGVPAFGPVTVWADQSGLAHHGVIPDPVFAPGLAADPLNGLPVIRFAGNQGFALPDLLANAPAGEIFAVLKFNYTPDAWGVQWGFGIGYGTGYSGNIRRDDFGLAEFNEVPGLTLAERDRFNIENTSAAPGEWVWRLDGAERHRFAPAELSWTAFPYLGATDFAGDIAEVIVYDRVLTPEERDAVHRYLTVRHAPPGIVQPATPELHAQATAGDQIDLVWSASTGNTQHQIATLERKTADGPFLPVATLADTYAYTDTGLTPGGIYTYRVKLSSYAGESSFSAPAAALTPVNSPALPASGLRLWLRAGAGTQGPGPVAVWGDQSGLDHDAIQILLPEARPLLVADVLNGHPVLRFDGDDLLQLPDVLAAATATAGELFAVLKVTPVPDHWNSPWRFGAVHPSSYINADHHEPFGTNDPLISPASPEASAYHVENVSIGDDLQVVRINGEFENENPSAPTAFTATPNLGDGTFIGDIAEIIVFDRVLTPEERDSVRLYLAIKYGVGLADATAPAAPSDLAASDLAASAVTLGWALATDNLAVTSYAIHRDGQLVGTVPATTPRFTLTGLAPGTAYDLTVTALDAAGNTSAPSAALTVTTLADTTAPAAPSGLAAVGVGPASVTLRWDAATDDVAVVAYEIYNDDALAGVSTAPYFQVTGLTLGQTHQFTVRARDAAANISPAGPALAVTPAADTNAPAAPADLALVLNLGDALRLTWPAATDDTGVVAYEVYRDDVLVATLPVTAAPAAVTETFTGLVPATTYAFTVRARDESGNTSPATAPLVVTTEGLPLTVPGLRLWLKADAGPVPDAEGLLAAWPDRSLHGQHATQLDPAQQPRLVADAANGRPVVRFDGDDRLNLPDALAGATAGELIAVVKITPEPERRNTLWWFGVHHESTYRDDIYEENFGLDGYNAHPASPVADEYHITNVSIGDNLMVGRLNGAPAWQRLNSPVGFRSDPNLGGGTLLGDIAELIVFDRVLTPAERDAVHAYLALKYAPPGMPVPAAPALTTFPIDGTTADLIWALPDATPQHLVATLERRVGAGDYAPVATLVNTHAYTDTGLTPGQTYTYRVKLASYTGESAYGDPVELAAPPSVVGLPADGLRIWLRSTAGVPPSGPIAAWLDQGPWLHDATQLYDSAACPSLVPDALNGHPVVRFDGNDRLELGDALAGATAGEIIAIVKITPEAGRRNSLWWFGLHHDSAYIDESHEENFGLDGYNSQPASSAAAQYHIANVSIDEALMVGRLNGAELWQLEDPAVGFRSEVLLGGGELLGDFAEVIVYDRVLTPVERAAVHAHLNAKYNLGAP